MTFGILFNYFVLNINFYQYSLHLPNNYNILYNRCTETKSSRKISIYHISAIFLYKIIIFTSTSSKYIYKHFLC